MILAAEVDAPSIVIWAVVGIALAMSILSRLFRKKFSMDPKSQMDMQTKNRDLQDKMKEARLNGDQDEMFRLNEELMTVMKGMYKKQMIPMLISSLIWFGVFGLMRLAFGQYERFLPFDFVFGGTLIDLYLITSFSFTGASLIYKLVKKKLTPEVERDKDAPVYDQIGALNQSYSFKSEESEINSSNESKKNEYQDAPASNGKTWKDRLDN